MQTLEKELVTAASALESVPFALVILFFLFFGHPMGYGVPGPRI